MLRRLLVLGLVCTLLASQSVLADGYTWNKVRYNGGTVSTKVDPKDWNNKLTISSDEIKFELKDKQTVVIDPKKVTGISYGQEAHRRVGTMIALGVLVTPLALFGLLHKTKLHFIGVEYETADGKKGGLLIQGHKDNYRAILQALKSTTGKEVEMSTEDKKDEKKK